MVDSERFGCMGKGFTLAQAVAEADRCLLCHDAPCSKGCPASTEPGEFIRKLRLKNITGAIRTIKTNNILGGACGVLCPVSRLCEKECSATGIGLPIKIGEIQRALVEHSWELGFQALAKPEASGAKVAVVGSGPAGLSCAAELAKEGFRVTVFEEKAEPGGVIRYGVPSYRFDKGFLEHELDDLRFLGVEFVCKARIDGAKGAQKLLGEGFKSVFLAPGLWKATSLPGAQGIENVHGSTEFLARLRGEKFDDLKKEIAGKDVAVIGGGSVAIDCAESALRLGARDLYLVYRRSFAQMPAEPDESLAALRAGIHFILLNQPVGYVSDARKRLTGLKLRRCRLGGEDASSRRAPVEISGSEWTLDVQVAIEAIGSGPDEADWSGIVKTDRRGLILSDSETGRAQSNGGTVAGAIFAGGDIVRGPALVVEAVRDGKVAARAIRDALAKGGQR
jgi:NADPH-dependent glutamate synthase beta subunit-like oxidoreductase